ncbi:MAG: Ice-structuring protein [Oscillospiraceae bacterium]|nr:Ice-structuring protein [Oscillospiraceae bacterium]
MAMMTNEEHERMKRRRFRQLVGLLVCFLVVMGVGTVISSGLGIVAALFDDTEKKQEYANKLQSMVMLDPLPFDTLEQADPQQLKEAAIWGTIYNTLATGSDLSIYERDPDTDGIILPALEVDATLTKLVGPNYKLTHGTFESSDMTFLYLEDKQGYLIPVTGQIGLYSPVVEDFARKEGRMYVTVGYIPTFSNTDFAFTAATEPTKYMDYVFERSDKNWYLVSLVESEMKPAEPAASEVVDTQNQIEADYDPAEELLNAVATPEPTEEVIPEGADAQAAAAPEEPEDPSAETGGSE